MAGISFGTDGWRGIMAADFTFANVRLVAQAIADHVLERYPGGDGRRVVIGYDHRFLSEHFAEAAAEVFAGRGLQVLLGERAMPTPVTAFTVVHCGAAGAVMLTASHNPPEYNGIKWIPEYGGPALPEVTREIEAQIRRREAGGAAEPGKPADGRRRPPRIDPRAAYGEHVRGLVDGEAIGRAGLSVVVDPLWGAGTGYLESILGEMGVRVRALHNYRDPLFGGSLPDPSEARLGALRERVLASGADLGLGLDGDADRLGIIDRDGSFISPNQLLALVYYHLLEARGERGPAARTVATTHMLDRLAEAHGTRVVETPVGFKYIGQSLMDRGCIVGGEESGGLSIRGHVPEKDGILAGLLAAEIAAVHRKGLGELMRDIHARLGPLYSGRRDVRTTPEKKKEVLERLTGLRPERLAGRTVRGRLDIDGLKLLLDDGAWVLVRASGTEPVFRIYAEAPAREGVAEVQGAMLELAGL
ncbi:MAG: phosphoglucomutase/phosphomannomutase family protein [Thermoanaerobacterales bacterium]|nr:phosphoglucomutase/phosphomannomutase family protein [Thermoanaerobacterales bacterium]